MFYSDEILVTRYKIANDRYPEYIAEVDAERRRNPEHLAMLGFRNDSGDRDSVYGIWNDLYFIRRHPSDTLLIKNGFAISTDSIDH
jgi:hypothetical protein